MNKKFNSIHLEEFPNMHNTNQHTELREKMSTIRSICNTALAIRDRNTIRIRMPIQELCIYGCHIDITEFTNVIAEEVNVKKITLHSSMKDKTTRTLVPNYAEIAHRSNMPNMSKIIKATKEGEWEQKSGQIEIADTTLQSHEYSIIYTTKSKNAGIVANANILVELDLTPNRELILEGIARDFIRFIQDSRKEMNLNVSDRISIEINSTSKVKEAIEANKRLITSRLLADKIDFIQDIQDQEAFTTKIDNSSMTAKIIKV